MSDRFVRQYTGVDVMFEPEAHEYFLQFPEGQSLQVPPVSEILDYLPKWLAAWAEANGIKGMQELVRRAIKNGPNSPDWQAGEVVPVDLSRLSLDDHKFNLGLIEGMGMDSTSIKNAAADRGTTVHAAYRGWVLTGVLPNPADYTGEVKGYIASLRMLCNALSGTYETILCEEPLCSVQYGFAGTPDHFVTLKRPVELQTGGNVGPGKRPKFTTFPAGIKPIIDLKTSKQVFMSHTYQLSAYELMANELSVGEPTHRWVVLIKPDGAGYNVKEQPDRIQGFLGALAIYNQEKRVDGWLGRQTFVGLAAAA